jgi:hypothetical protein
LAELYTKEIESTRTWKNQCENKEQKMSLKEYKPGTAFTGVVGRTYDQSEPAWPVAPRGHLCMLNDYVLPKQSFVACPNQDVAYGVLFASLNDEPVVIQVPDFGDRF